MNKKVLVAAPTSSRHSYVIDEWLSALAKQTHKNFDILLIDTSEKPEFFEKLCRKGLRVLRNPWDGEKNAIVQHLADVREQYRKIAVKEGYDYLFNLDTDVILPKNGIEELISCDKDQVGYVVHVFPKGMYQPPCVFKGGKIVLNKTDPEKNGLEYYSWDWVSKYKGQLKKVYGTGLGVLLVKRKVFEEVQFRTHPSFVYGEDLWYYAEADDKGFEAWCLVKRVVHKNAEWKSVVSRQKKNMQMYIAMGPPKAKEAVWV